MASSPASHCLLPTLSRPVGLIEPWLTKRIQSLPLMSPMLFLPAHTTAYSGLLPAAAEAPAALYWAVARSLASIVPGTRFWVTWGTSLTLLMASTWAWEIFSAWATDSGPELPLEAPWYAPRTDRAPAMTTAVRARPRRSLITAPPMVRTLPRPEAVEAPGRSSCDGRCDVGCDVFGWSPNSDLVDHIIREGFRGVNTTATARISRPGAGLVAPPAGGPRRRGRRRGGGDGGGGRRGRRRGRPVR